MENRRRYFTLVELLITIAIIAILAGLLLPALNKARSRARQGACMSQVKQLVAACQSYANDAQGFFPGASGLDGPDPARVDTDGSDWTGLALLYFSGVVRDKKVMFCPTQTKYTLQSSNPKGFGRKEYSYQTPEEKYVYAGYFYLGNFYCSYGTKGDYKNILFARGPGLPQIVRPGPAGISHGTPRRLPPSTETLVMDIASNKSENAPFFEQESSHWDHGNISGANIGYSDGHVAWKKVSAMRCTDGIKISGGRFLHR